MRLSGFRARAAAVALTAAVIVSSCADGGEDLVKNSTLQPQAVYVIAGMGDSFGSGEGNPVRSGSGAWEDTVWYSADRPLMSEICHRSSASGFYKAVRRLEEKYPNIDFVRKNFACSGAVVEDILSEQQEPGNEQFAAASSGRDGLDDVGSTQLEQLSAWVDEQLPPGARLDALYLSIGGNNARFADALTACMLRGDALFDCAYSRAVQDGSAVVSQRDTMSQQGRSLYRLYNDLDVRLHATVDPRQVVISTYPNFAKRANGSWCDMNLISSSEFRDLWRLIGAPLNDRIVDRASALGWDVATMENRFSGHGVCESAGRRWINTSGDAIDRQGRDMAGLPLSTGMYHPNDAGYEAYADAIEEALEAELVDRLTPGPRPSIQVSATSISPTANTVPGRRVAGSPWYMVQVTLPPGGSGVDAISSVRVRVTLPDGSVVTDTFVPAAQPTFFVRMPSSTTLQVSTCGFQYGPAADDVYCSTASALYRTLTPLSGATSVAPGVPSNDSPSGGPRTTTTLPPVTIAPFSTGSVPQWTVPGSRRPGN